MISDSQFGFCKNHSTGHAIHHSVDLIKEGLESKKQIVGIFIDLSKAFDTLDHEFLLRKLGNCGIRGISNGLLRSYLSNRKQFIHVMGEKSSIEPVLFAVYKIPYRRAPRLAFRPSASREQRYLAYNIIWSSTRICTLTIIVSFAY